MRELEETLPPRIKDQYNNQLKVVEEIIGHSSHKVIEAIMVKVKGQVHKILEIKAVKDKNHPLEGTKVLLENLSYRNRRQGNSKKLNQGQDNNQAGPQKPILDQSNNLIGHLKESKLQKQKAMDEGISQRAERSITIKVKQS